jgi:hypothetical protein
VRSVTPSKETMQDLMSVAPWRNGWLEYNTLDGWRRWWSSLNTTVESVRILGGMIVVTSRVSNTSKVLPRLLDFSPASNSGYRLGSDSSLSASWQATPHLKTSSSKSVIHSFANLDDIAVAASPTLQELRHECRLTLGDYV